MKFAIDTPLRDDNLLKSLQVLDGVVQAWTVRTLLMQFLMVVGKNVADLESIQLEKYIRALKFMDSLAKKLATEHQKLLCRSVLSSLGFVFDYDPIRMFADGQIVEFDPLVDKANKRWLKSDGGFFRMLKEKKMRK